MAQPDPHIILSGQQEDLPDLMAMGQRFHDVSGLPGEFDAEVCSAFVQGLIDSPDGAVFRSERGVIMGVATPGYSTPGWKMAVELAWWSEDGSGLALIRAFEAWAESVGANEIRMTAIVGLMDERVERILDRMGYRPAETSYRKAI